MNSTELLSKIKIGRFAGKSDHETLVAFAKFVLEESTVASEEMKQACREFLLKVRQ